MSSCIFCLSIIGINVEVSDHVNKSKVKISGLQQWFLSLYLPNECNKEGLEDE